MKKPGKRKKQAWLAKRKPSQPETFPQKPRDWPQPKDSKQQLAILKQSRSARLVRQKFPPGTRVVSAAAQFGTVERHVPTANAAGGHLVVRWDSGTVGRHSASQLVRMPAEEVKKK